MNIRPMIPSDETTVRELSATLPDMDMEKERPPGFHLNGHHTLVAVSDDGAIVGHTTWSHHKGFTMWDETVVHKDHQGKGIGRELMLARAKQTPGNVFGTTADENEAMVHLLTHTFKMHPCQRFPLAYGGRHDAVLYTRHKQTGN